MMRIGMKIFKKSIEVTKSKRLPINEPNTAETIRLFKNLLFAKFWKSFLVAIAAEIAPGTKPKLFEAFATIGLTPKRSKVGKVINVPLPTIQLMNPALKDAPNRMSKLPKSSTPPSSIPFNCQWNFVGVTQSFICENFFNQTL